MKYNQPFGEADPDASYVDRNTPGAVAGSKVPGAALEDPQREIAHVIDYFLGDGTFGSAQDPADLEQLRKAIQLGVSGRADIPVSGWQSAPPASPVEGDRYIVKPTATGAWAGNDNAIAMWAGAAWVFAAPVAGLQVQYWDSRHVVLRFDGTNWAEDNLIRRRLTADTSFYVNGATGSDSNDGSIGAPWATIPKAAAYLKEQLDLSGFTVTVNVAAGTYTDGFYLSSPLVGQVSVQSVQVVGNVANPVNCFVNSPTGGAGVASNGAAFQIKGFQVSATSSVAQNGSGLYASTGGIISYESMAFNTCFNAHVFAELGGYCVASGSNTINSSAPSHLFAKDSGTISVGAQAHTLTGGPTFVAAFAQAETGTIEAVAANFSGAASGPRFYANILGAIKCGGNVNFFPGNAAGSVNAGGQYV